MRAVLCQHPGPPGVLKVVEQPVPQPGPGEVLIAVAYAAVTFVETQVRAGILPPGGGRSFPFVLGNGVAGVVVRVGAGVDPLWTGEGVVAATGGSGGYAEFAVAPAGALHRIPPGLDARDAAALLADGRTALALARAARIAKGESVLVTAAAGGVGSLLVQLAREAGAALVIGLAGGERKLELARALGAHVAVDYRQPGWELAVQEATGLRGVDVAFDGVGGGTGKAVTGLLRRGGRYLPHGMASGTFYEVPPEKAAEIEVLPLRSLLAGPEDEYRLVEEALGAAAARWIRPVIGQVFPLECAAEAHAAIEARRTLGKTLLAARKEIPS